MECLALCEDLGLHWGRGFALNNLALAADRFGEGAQALALAEQSVALFRDLGVALSLAEALTTLGRIVRHAMGEERARSVLREAVRLAWARGARLVLAAAIEEVAALAARTGQAPRTAQLCGAAAALRAAMGVPVPPLLQDDQGMTEAAARAALAAEDFATAWRAGEALALEQAVGVALAAL
jgi:hypothetical protein